jgi:hypothetical protein
MKMPTHLIHSGDYCHRGRPTGQSSGGENEGLIFTTSDGQEIASPVNGATGWMQIGGRRYHHIFTNNHWILFVRNGTEWWS